MSEPGFNWSIAAVRGEWAWTLRDIASGQTLVTGRAPSRSVAAAMVVRAIARGMAPQEARSLAA